MKRLYLAASPWFKVATDEMQRVVLYRKNDAEVVVHTQAVIGGRSSMFQGDYFGHVSQWSDAVKRWTERSAGMATAPLATAAEAEAANAADLASQYQK